MQRIKITLSLDKHVLAKIQKMADEDSRSVSKMLEILAIKGIETLPKKKQLTQQTDGRTA